MTKKVSSTKFFNSVTKLMDIFKGLKVKESPQYFYFQTRVGMCGQLMVVEYDGYPLYEIIFFFTDANGKPYAPNNQLTSCPLSFTWTTAYAELQWDEGGDHQIYDMNLNKFKMAIDSLDLNDYHEVEGVATYTDLDGRLTYDNDRKTHTIKFIGDTKYNWFGLCQ